MIWKKCISTLVLVIIGGLITVSISFTSCDSNKEKISQTSQQREKRNREVEDLRTSLINRHNAIVFPPKDFGKRKVFTYNLQTLLINKAGRPILFDGTLEDITKDNGYFTVHFSSHLAEYDLGQDPLSLGRILDKRRIRFHLKCRYEDVKSLLDDPPKGDHSPLSEYDILNLIFSKWGEFCVVAVITRVNKIIRYTIEGHPSGSEDIELEIESPDTFNVTGELVEMLKYPSIDLTEQR